MLFGLLLVLILGGVLLVHRTGAASVERDAWAGGATQRAVWWHGAGVLAGSAVLLGVAPGLHPNAPVLFGDSASHAQVARDIARHALPHGWLDTYLGGFPFGHHYPPLGWLLLAAAIRAGASPTLAVHALGWLATLAVPLTLYAVLVRARANPVFAAVAGLFSAWVNPYNPFVGGYEAFFTNGLVSQVLALPLCIALAGAVAAGGALGTALLAALAVAAHPELTLSTLAVVTVVALAGRRRGPLERTLRALAASLALGLALYGQGLATLDVPFGWPPGFGWRQLGFGTSRFAWWFLDGDLLDYGAGVPVLTPLAGAALVVLGLRARRPAARAALVATVTAIALGACGPLLASSGTLGRVLLTAVQPLRALALLPPLAAVLVAVALEEARPLLAAVLSRLGRPRLAPRLPALLGLVVTLLLCFALPARLRALSLPALMLARPLGSACPDPPAGYQPDAWRAELRALRGGRLWFSQRESSEVGVCFERDGLTLESGVPLATTAAVGAHLGVEWLAAQRLEPARAGAVERAEALGVRHLVLGAAEAIPDGFELAARHDGLALLTSLAPTNLAGAGCIAERWQGTDSAVRARLSAELGRPDGADRLLDPRRLVTLEAGPGDVFARSFTDDCDAGTARVTSHAPEPGVLEVSVESAAPVELVLRVSWFPSWRVTLDGETVGTLTKVAPGYPALRVPAGAHRVVARASSLPGYGGLVLLGLLAVGAAGTSSRGALLSALRSAVPRSRPPS